MKEIGERLKETRESMSITIEEACSDLKIRESEIISIEEGNMDKFKDIYYLRGLVKDYSRYLGLNPDDVVDDFNEFVFDFTSKISLDDIKEEKKEEEKVISSPYTTIPTSNYKKIVIIVLFILVIISIIILSVMIYERVNTPNVIG